MSDELIGNIDKIVS